MAIELTTGQNKSNQINIRRLILIRILDERRPISLKNLISDWLLIGRQSDILRNVIQTRIIINIFKIQQANRIRFGIKFRQKFGK